MSDNAAVAIKTCRRADLLLLCQKSFPNDFLCFTLNLIMVMD